MVLLPGIGPPYWTEVHIWCCYQKLAHPTGQMSIYGAATRNWPSLLDRGLYMLVLLPGIGPPYRTDVNIWIFYLELAHPTGQRSIYSDGTRNWPTLQDRCQYMDLLPGIGPPYWTDIVLVPEIGPPYRTDVNIWIFYQELAHPTRQRSIYVGAATKNRPTLLDRSPYMVLLPGIYIVLYGTHTQ